MRDQLSSLPSFDSGEKRSDPRYKWFMFNYGRVDRRCWEIDALDPNVLREIIEGGIAGCIKDTDAWERCELVNEAERESLQGVLTGWAAE